MMSIKNLSLIQFSEVMIIINAKSKSSWGNMELYNVEKNSEIGMTKIVIQKIKLPREVHK